jgi:hypothetical protein
MIISSYILKSSKMSSPQLIQYNLVSSLVSSWIRRKKSYLYNQNNIQVLSIMILERRGYSFEDINTCFSNSISKERYKKRSNQLEPTYQEMSSHLRAFLDRKSSKINDSDENFDEYQSNKYQSDESMDWYDCNSVDRRDGSKYIGYTRREYEDSRFGSFPIHDDYGDESWADENPLDANW